MLVDAVTAGVPSAYVVGLDHGSADLHGFVAAGLIYCSEANPNFDELLRFYQKPGWHEVLRRFANIDDDEAAILAETQKAIDDLRRH